MDNVELIQFKLTTKPVKPKLTKSQLNRLKGVRVQQKEDLGLLSSIIWNDDLPIRERMVVYYLNRAHYLLGYEEHSVGGMHGTIIDHRIITANALLTGASAVVLAHNHPSGNKRPSPEDLKITREIKECLNLFKIELLDHLIITGREHGQQISFINEI